MKRRKYHDHNRIQILIILLLTICFLYVKKSSLFAEKLLIHTEIGVNCINRVNF